MATETTPTTRTGSPPDEKGESHLGLALLVIATAQLMVVLDASIVNVALPSIQDALDFSQANLAWVINGYTLAFGGLLLLGGRAGDLFGRRRVFIAGIILFSLASLLGGFATSEGWLIGARILQGAGAAVASPTALSLITTTFPEGAPRNRAMAVYAAMSGAGAAVGLVAGGLLTDYASWRWVLFVNVPIGALVVFLAPRVLNESEPGDGRIDWTGAILGTVGLSSIVYGITRAGDPANGFGDSVVIISFTVGVLLMAAFIAVEQRAKHPIMPLRLWRERNRLGANASMLLIGAALFATFYFLTLFTQYILGYSPVKSGLAFLPFTVALVVGAGIASALAPRVPPRLIAGPGIVLAAVGTLWYARLEPGSSYLTNLLPPMVVVAFGMGLAFVPLTLAAVAGTGQNDAGIASALLNTTQQVGGSLGLAILATISAHASDDRLLGAFDKFRDSGAAAAKGDQGALAVIQRAKDALTHGYSTAFVTAGVMLVVAVVLVAALVNASAQQVESNVEEVEESGLTV